MFEPQPHEHDMEMTCVGDTYGEGGFLHVPDCTFRCRIKASSHEEGLHQAAELHRQHREEQVRLRKEAMQQNEKQLVPLWEDELPQVTICEKFKPWVYPEPCWDCFMRDPEFEAEMTKAMIVFANIALNGIPRTIH